MMVDEMFKGGKTCLDTMRLMRSFFYATVRFGVLLVSDAYGVETFRYESEEARDEGLRTLCSEIEVSDDFVDRDIAIIRDG